MYSCILPIIMAPYSNPGLKFRIQKFKWMGMVFENILFYDLMSIIPDDEKVLKLYSGTNVGRYMF